MIRVSIKPGAVQIVVGQPSGSTLVYARKGNFYFQVEPAAPADWSVTVGVPSSLASSTVSPANPARLTGTGLQNTLPFTVSTSPWELTWQSGTRLTIIGISREAVIDGLRFEGIEVAA